MPFFTSKKKAAKSRRELSPIGRLTVGAAALAKTTTAAISSSHSELSTIGRDQLASASQSGIAASPVVLEARRYHAEAAYAEQQDTRDSATFTNSLEAKHSLNSEITNVSAEIDVDHFQRHYPETSERNRHGNELERERVKSPSIISSDTQGLLRDLRGEIVSLNETNLNLRTDKQILVDRLESNIEVLTQENTMLKTQINAAPPENTSRRDMILGNSEKIEELTSVLEAQIDVLASEYNISPARASQNKSPRLLKRMEQHIPPWVSNFDDLGPLIEAFNTRLQIAYRKILENQTAYDAQITAFETQTAKHVKDRETLEQHLVDQTQRYKSLEEQTEELIHPLDAQKVLDAEKETYAKQLKSISEELDSQITATKTAEATTHEAHTKLTGAIKTNQKYIATQQTLMEKVDQLGAELAISRSKETELKHHVNRSVSLLEKALQERDIYHQLAAREHENCRHAINSASSLKLQHLRDLSNMFKENQARGTLMKAHDPVHMHSLQNEINTLRGNLANRADELEKTKDSRRDMLKQIDDMVEKMSIPVKA